jgi:signal transduction histidine kinase
MVGVYGIKMKLSPKSIRQKIFLGYLGGAVLVLGFVLLSWNNLDNLEEMVKSGEAVSDLFDTALEIRRFEKNYFLYGTDYDYGELFRYVFEAEELIQRDEISLFASPQVIYMLDRRIQEYLELLKDNIEELDDSERMQLKAELRAKGKEIVNIAEQISANRKLIKRESLVDAKMHLLVGIMLLIVAGIFAAILFYMKAVRPLSVIEQHMDRISGGEFSLIDTRFKDSELVSLKVAFNKMLLELQTRQSHLVQSEKVASIGTLVFGVAHELNNPLSNIYTSAQILNEELESGDIEYKRELLSQIESETERAKEVVGSVLDYSRSKEKVSFNLRRAMEEAIRLMKAEIPAGVTIAANVPEDIALFADKQKIQQVILNLINNAVDAMEDEGEISISASQESDMVEILVQDNGEGMDQKTLKKVFDPFYSSKKDKKGYGLGLFIVNKIINEHGGSISVDSSPNIGTVFTIMLPQEES